MKTSEYKQLVQSQFSASCAMLGECIESCPSTRWNAIIGKYSFWHVAYHTIESTDMYCAKSLDVWKPDRRFHPNGRKDIDKEYPSRRFTKRELLAYLAHTNRRVRAAIRAETSQSLVKPAGFPWLTISRSELHMYSMRHVQHHTGQLSAFLRRNKVSTKWVQRGV